MAVFPATKKERLCLRGPVGLGKPTSNVKIFWEAEWVSVDGSLKISHLEPEKGYTVVFSHVPVAYVMIPNQTSSQKDSPMIPPVFLSTLDS